MKARGSALADGMDEDAPARRKPRWRGNDKRLDIVGIAQVGLFVLALGFVLHQCKPVLLPVVLAVLVSLVLHPVYVAFRRLRLPRFLASAATVSGMVALVGFGAYQLVEPGTRWFGSLDGESVSARLHEVFRPVKEMREELKQVAHRVERVTGGAAAAEPGGADRANGENATVQNASSAPAEAARPPEEAEPVEVKIREDPLDALVVATQELGVGIVAFLFLVLFILAYGNRIVRCLSEEDGTARVLERMGADVSKYLFTITLINLCLGICIALAMWALGMPNPALWGVLGMVLNYIPYVGAIIGVGIVFLVAVATMDGALSVLAVPLAYFLLTALEGNVVTPLVLGGRFRLNPLVVFLWIFAWAGFWGVAGILIAMPALVTFKIICETTSTMDRFRRVLGS